MRLLLLCLLTVGSFSIGVAQELSIEPDQVEILNIQADQFEAIAHSEVTNNTASRVNYKWVRTTLTTEGGWTNAVCDINQCYLPTVDTEEFELDANQTGLLDVHAYPGNMEGSTTVEVTVSRVSDANVAVTGLYYFNQVINSTDDESALQRVRVYPNPTTGLFTFDRQEAVAEVVVYSLTGQPVRRFVTADSPTYDIRSLPQGAYIVRLFDADRQVLANRMLQKQ